VRYLLDTNVLSELSKAKPEPHVMEWFSNKITDELLICAITVGEIAYGIERKEAGQNKDELRDWFESTLLEWFDGKIVFVDDKVMLKWAHIRVTGRTLPILDSMIAASTLTAEATLVTRNIKDFDSIKGLVVINPWD
jgi:predicted nucleic acid-binding protein